MAINNRDGLASVKAQITPVLDEWAGIAGGGAPATWGEVRNRLNAIRTYNNLSPVIAATERGKEARERINEILALRDYRKLELDFINDYGLVIGPNGRSGPLSSLLTIQRASSGTYFDADGVLRTADNNELRIDHDPVTGEPRGALIERQATNLFLHSEDASSAYWTVANLTVTADAATAPDGATTMDLLTDSVDGSAVQHALFRVISGGVAGTTYCLSRFVKAGTAERVAVTLTGPAFDGVSRSVVFDFRTGTVTSSGTVVGFGAEDCGAGIRRVWVSATAGVAGNIWTYVLTDNGATTFYQGDGTRTVYVWGHQLEVGSRPTSYIKTEGSQVTRAADNISIPLSAFPWNEAEMTAIVEFQTFGLLNIPTAQYILARESDARFLYQISNGTLAGYDGTNHLDLGVISTGQVVKAVSSFGPRGLRGCVNGGSVVSAGYDGTFGTSPNLYLGSLNGSNGHSLHFRKLKLFPRQLSDAEMQAATA